MQQTKTPFFDLVNEDIREVDARMRSKPGEVDPNLEAAIDHLLTSGGKRIRPTLTLLSGGMFGADRASLITLAAAIELLHTATLVHDDLIDGSLLRRGTPTLNAQWTPAATVLTGDYVFARAAHLAAETNSLRLMRIFARTLMTMVRGEITQLFRSKSADLYANYLERIYAKTASLFEVASQGPALLAGCDEATVQTMKVFGYEIGIAFQIVDDMLDFTGDQARVGKPVASDLRQGVITLPALTYYKEYPDDPILQSIIQGERPTEKSIKELLKHIRKSGAIEQTFQKAKEYVEKGQSRLIDMTPSPERDALIQLAEYVVQRPF